MLRETERDRERQRDRDRETERTKDLVLFRRIFFKIYLYIILITKFSVGEKVVENENDIIHS